MSKFTAIEQLPMRFTKTLLQRQKSSTKLKKKLQQSTYFCHFSNALYMGGIRAYKKNQKGMILHDDGTCAIVSYGSDVPNGHHIIFKPGMILSKIHHLDRRTDYVLRMNRYLIQIPYNQDQLVDGRGTLIDFFKQQIWHLQYKKGYLKSKKIVRQEKIHVQVFTKKNFKYLIGQIHQQAFDLDFQKHKEIKIIKEGDATWIGFTGQNDKKLMNGLAFKILITQKVFKQANQFDLSILQRGQYSNSKLNGLGQRHFNNGNLYYGNFTRNQFEGKGFLSYPDKDKWVFGVFHQGKLCDLIDVKSDEFHDSWRKNIKKLHNQQQKWIDRNVSLPNQAPLLKLLNQSLEAQDDSSYIKKRSLQKEQKKLTMNKIQENFLFSNSRVQIDNVFQIAQRQRQRSIQKQKKRFNSQSRSKQKDNSMSKEKNKSPEYKYQLFELSKLKNENFESPELNLKSVKNQKHTDQSEIKQHKIDKRPQFTVIERNQPIRTVTVGNLPKFEAEVQANQILKLGHLRRNQIQQQRQAILMQNYAQTMAYKQTKNIPSKSSLQNNKNSRSYNKIAYYETDRNFSRTPVKADKTFDTQTRKIIRAVQNQESYDRYSKPYKNTEIKNEKYNRRAHYKYLDKQQEKSVLKSNK